MTTLYGDATQNRYYSDPTGQFSSTPPQLRPPEQTYNYSYPEDYMIPLRLTPTASPHPTADDLIGLRKLEQQKKLAQLGNVVPITSTPQRAIPNPIRPIARSSRPAGAVAPVSAKSKSSPWWWLLLVSGGLVAYYQHK